MDLAGNGRPVNTSTREKSNPMAQPTTTSISTAAQRQGGDADRGACRVGLGEVLAVRLTHHREIGYVSQADADSEHVS